MLKILKLTLSLALLIDQVIIPTPYVFAMFSPRNVGEMTQKNEDILNDDADSSRSSNITAVSPAPPLPTRRTLDKIFEKLFLGKDLEQSLKQDKLYDKIIKNLHPPLLKLDNRALSEANNLIFQGLAKTKSVRFISFRNTSFNVKSYMAFLAGLAENRSINTIDFYNAKVPKGALTSLAVVLKEHPNIEEVHITWQQDLIRQDIELFYQILEGHKTLCKVLFKPTFHELFETFVINCELGLAKVHLGFFYADKGLFNKAEEWLKKADNPHKYPQAAYCLGELYETKKVGNNPEDPFGWYMYLLAANLNYSKAYYKLSDYYRGVLSTAQNRYTQEPNYQQAYELLLKAAKNDYPEALYRLGRIYLQKHPIAPNETPSLKKAAIYFYCAGIQGHKGALRELGLVYKNPDYEEYNNQAGDYYIKWSEMLGDFHAKNFAKDLIASNIQSQEKLVNVNFSNVVASSRLQTAEQRGNFSESTYCSFPKFFGAAKD